MEENKGVNLPAVTKGYITNPYRLWTVTINCMTISNTGYEINISACVYSCVFVLCVHSHTYSMVDCMVIKCLSYIEMH